MASPLISDSSLTPTADEITERIVRETEERIRFLANRPAQISVRLQQLDAEWDVERAIEANAAPIALAGVLLAILSPYWLIVPALAMLVLSMHAVQGGRHLCQS